MPRYDAKRIEARWQEYWETNQTFRTEETVPTAEAALKKVSRTLEASEQLDENRMPESSRHIFQPTGKLYVLDMFPYPSGSGLHVGHPEGYTATDIVCRYSRMKGMNVLHPMGWDAFGLPAEEHAVKTGTHPRITTEQNIATFKRQLKMLGFSYDWTRELSTTDPEYYRWTQWIFLQIFETWYDASCVWTGPDGKHRVGRGRPISELPIPADVTSQGIEAVRRYQDKHRLAYISEAPVNWCPALGTVLANEEIIDGKSERGDHPVVRMPLKQWMLRITAYADRLASELEELNWSESIKFMQRNWIGRSTGAEVDFFVVAASPLPCAGGEGQREGVGASSIPHRSTGEPPHPASGHLPPRSGEEGTAESADATERWKASRIARGFPSTADADVIRVYTTRPDTLFGVTYMVLAPEHALVDAITTTDQRAAVDEYRRKASMKSDLDRTDLAKEKSGVFTGGYAINPVNGERVPVWVADYVLISYGTGAIMAVPGHDERDYEFATTFGISIVQVVAPAPGSSHIAELANAAFTETGLAVNSGRYNGLFTSDFKSQISNDLAQAGLGKEAVNYRLRDWLFSRQRYWGEPFPIWHELDTDGKPTGLMRADAAEALPVLHPHMEDFKPSGTPDPMLAKAPDSWLYKTDTDGVKLKRETNSMPQWAGSCWYYLRFCDNKNSERFIDAAKEKYWLPVDLYIGGAEHAVLHLLYSRFWHKVLFDRGHVSTAEPFQKLENQGMILGEPDENGKAEKMSKSRGNVINPDDIVREYGADSLRLYEMFMGPLEQSKPWQMNGVEGVYRFLGRVWRLMIDDRSEDVVLSDAVVGTPPSEDQLRILHKTIKAVTDDIDRLAFNTAISRMMEFTNFMSGQETRSKSVLESFVILLSPFAPHIAEELWNTLGHSSTLAYEPWPAYAPALLVEDTIEIPIQVNGKLRAKIIVPAHSDSESLEVAARADETIQKQLAGKTVVKVVTVPGRMVNFVVR